MQRTKFWILTNFLILFAHLFTQNFNTSSTLHAQDTIYHSDAQLDDGDPELDGDGKVNNVVVWKGGAIHKMNTGYYSVYSGYTLVIESGATVQGVANLRDNYQIIGQNAADSKYSIQKATVNDISFTGFRGPGSSVKNSTLTNCQLDLPQGGEFRANKIENGSVNIVSPAELEGIEEDPPVIMNNEFQESTLSAVGSAAIIQGNTFFDTRVTGSRKYPVTSIQLGYARSASGIVYPSGSVQTQITNNSVTSGGIVIDSRIDNQIPYETLDSQPLRVLIQGNTLRGFTDNDVRKGTGLTLETFNDIQVVNNELSGFSVLAYLKTELKSEASADSREPHENFTINNNVFTESNEYGMYWQRNFEPRGTLDENDFVDATNNFWGHNTGPNDASDADGFFNDGQGLDVDDYITYTPYQGQTDFLASVKLDMTAYEDEIFLHGASYTLDADVSYKIYEGPATLEIRITDDQGLNIADPKPKMTIEAGEHTVAMENMQISVPANTDWFSCQALISKGGQTVTSSNIEDFFAFDPGYGIRITDFEIQPTQDGKEEYIPGVEAQVTFKTEHTFPDLPGENTGRILVTANEYASENPPYFLQNFDVRLVPVNPGEDLKTNFTLSLTPPLREYHSNWTQIVIEAKLLVNDEEKTVARQVNNVSRDANIIELSGVRSMIDGKNTGRFCIEDEPVRIQVDKLTSQVLTPYLSGNDFTGWHVTSEIDGWFLEHNGESHFVGSSEMQDADNPGLPFSVDVQQKSEIFSQLNLISGEGFDDDCFLSLNFELNAPGVGIVYQKYGNIKVLDNYEIESYSVPAGKSDLTIYKSNCRCTFRGVEEEGEVTVLFLPNAKLMYSEFMWSVYAQTILKGGKSQGVGILLDRYWKFFTDLRAGSFSADMTFTYDPELDFPKDIEIDESQLTVAIWDTTTSDLTFIPTERNVETNELTVTLTDLNTPVMIGVPTNPSALIERQPEVSKPDHFTLEQNYPNPFNGETVIRFCIPDESDVRLEIYDIQGRHIATLLDQQMNAGEHQVNWQGKNTLGESVSSGLYIYRLQTIRKRASGKMLYMK